MKPTVDGIAQRFSPEQSFTFYRGGTIQTHEAMDELHVWFDIWNPSCVLEGEMIESEHITQVDAEAYVAVCIAYGLVRGYTMSKEEK